MCTVHANGHVFLVFCKSRIFEVWDFAVSFCIGRNLINQPLYSLNKEGLKNEIPDDSSSHVIFNHELIT